MTEFLELFTLFCSSSFFEAILQVLVPVVLVASAMTIVGVILHGKFV